MLRHLLRIRLRCRIRPIIDTFDVFRLARRLPSITRIGIRPADPIQRES